MNLQFFIARRYYFSKKNTNVINIISLISILGVAVGSFALIVILSVFNGMEEIAVSNFNSFDPEIKIEKVEGKYFNTSLFTHKLQKLPEIDNFSYSLTESALVKYQEKQQPFNILGVDSNFKNITGIDTMIIRGNFNLSQNNLPSAIIGYSVEYELSVGIYLFYPLNIYLPKRNTKISLVNPESAFKKSNISPVGVYGIDKSIDDFIIVPLNFLQKNASSENMCDAINIKLNKNTNIKKIKHKLKKIVGSQFTVKDRFQQHEFIYKVLKSEKTMVFLILIFILLIASFNIIGSIAMLILDKKNDIFTLKSIGTPTKKIRQIFTLDGLLISQTGIFLGLILGVLIVWLQTEYGFIKFAISSNELITNAYPVKFKFLDLISVYITVSIIGIIASYLPVYYIFKKHHKNTI